MSPGLASGDPSPVEPRSLNLAESCWWDVCRPRRPRRNLPLKPLHGFSGFAGRLLRGAGRITASRAERAGRGSGVVAHGRAAADATDPLPAGLGPAASTRAAGGVDSAGVKSRGSVRSWEKRMVHSRLLKSKTKQNNNNPPKTKQKQKPRISETNVSIDSFIPEMHVPCLSTAHSSDKKTTVLGPPEVVANTAPCFVSNILQPFSYK